MKRTKWAAVSACACLAASLLAGCSSEETGSETSASIPSAPSAATTTTAATEKNTTIRFRTQEDTDTLGVWWWQVNTIQDSDGLLGFLQENAVSEIYLCIDGMTDSDGARASFADVRAFVKKAGGMGMRVAALTGDYSWIEPDSTGFERYVDKFNAYQQAAAEDEKFYSMHLDVEPHQHPDFKTGDEGRAKVMQMFADFALQKAAPAAAAAGTILEWDIPFWMTDTVLDGDGQEIELARLMAKTCDTIAIMSYRDTAAQILDVAKEEIDYAQEYGCKIILGVETKSSEGDAVSFMEEGKAVMVEEMEKVHESLLASFPDGNFGMAVHQASVWYTLQD